MTMPRKLMQILLATAAVIGSSRAAPSTYDQRQDGDVNVKVDLDNFVILVARPVSALDVFGSMSQLLADSKHAPQFAEPPGDQAQGSESKSAAEDAPTTTPLDDKPETQQDTKEEEEEEEKKKKTSSAAEPVVAARMFKNSKSKYKLVEAVEEPQSLKLVGDAVENCGPGRSRDRSGICQEDGAK